MTSRDRIEFLYASIADMQGTIRAIDFKAWVLIGSITLPAVTLAGAAGRTARLIVDRSPGVVGATACALTGTVVLCLFLAVLLCLRAIGAIFDPTRSAERVASEHPECGVAHGAFFPISNLQFSFFRVLLNRATTPAQFVPMPDDIDSVNRELLFQQSKLAFVAAWKVAHTRYAYALATVGMAGSVLVWVMHCIW